MIAIIESYSKPGCSTQPMTVRLQSVSLDNTYQGSANIKHLISVNQGFG
jgi:hypothetical protein